jgi:hypothetical protein
VRVRKRRTRRPGKRRKRKRRKRRKRKIRRRRRKRREKRIRMTGVAKVFFYYDFNVPGLDLLIDYKLTVSFGKMAFSWSGF